MKENGNGAAFTSVDSLEITVIGFSYVGLFTRSGSKNLQQFQGTFIYMQERVVGIRQQPTVD